MPLTQLKRLGILCRQDTLGAISDLLELASHPIKCLLSLFPERLRQKTSLVALRLASVLMAATTAVANLTPTTTEKKMASAFLK